MCFNFSFKERDAPSLKTLDSRGTLILSSSMEYTSHGVLGMLSHVCFWLPCGRHSSSMGIIWAYNSNNNDNYDNDSNNDNNNGFGSRYFPRWLFLSTVTRSN